MTALIASETVGRGSGEDEMTEPTPVPDEDVLPDDYPMYGDYWYVIDGKPRRCDWMRTTVAEYKRREGAKEIRRCNIVFRAGRTPIAGGGR